MSNGIDIMDLFPSAALCADTDGDGYPDRLDLGIVVPATLNDSRIWCGVLNLTARLAMEVVALSFPVVTTRTPSPFAYTLVVGLPGDLPPGRAETLPPAMLCPVSVREVHLVGSHPQAMAAMLESLAGIYSSGMPADGGCPPAESHPSRVDGPDLLNCSSGGFYQTDPKTPRSRALRIKIGIAPTKLSCPVGLALSEMVARLALEATELSLPLVFSKIPGDAPPLIRIMETRQGPAGIRITKPASPRWAIEAYGSAKSLADLLKNWCAWALSDADPGNPCAESIRDRVQHFQDLISGRGYWGRWAHALVQAEPSQSQTLPPAPGTTWYRLRDACRRLGLTPPSRQKPTRPLIRTTRWQDETQKILRWVKTVPAGSGPLDGLILVSKPVWRRNILKTEVEAMLTGLGYRPEIRVLNAYKPGLCWLMEAILPRLSGKTTVSAIQIFYRPFSADACLEMPSRWLQEIYPGAELLAAHLGLDSSQILTEPDPGLVSVYRVQAIDDAGRCLLDEPFSPRVWPMPAIGGGAVHPGSAMVFFRQGQRVLLDQLVMTDRQRLWQVLQNRWLPELESEMAKRLEFEPAPPAFWEEVRLQVAIQETDLRLGIGSERICPMEALHEDIYFGLLAFFEDFSRRHELPDTVSFGRIVPEVFAATKSDTSFARLRAKPLAPLQAPPEPNTASPGIARVIGLKHQNRLWLVELTHPGHHFTENQRQHLLAIACAWNLQASWTGNGFRLHHRMPVFHPPLIQAPEPMPGPAQDRLLPAETVHTWLDRLGRWPMIRTWTAARSWQKRPVRAMELISVAKDRLFSLSKLRLLKPTVLFNARHHANEISSTNAALATAWHLGSTPEGARMLRHVNVVMIPMENPDGVATLEQLIATAGDHKLHAARYNALGAEFYGDYFRETPRFPEAGAKTRLWRRWLPQAMVDHHGVPDHEWDQPFAGYAPVRFREFWIPRTFVFVYIPFIEAGKHPAHAAACQITEALGQAMAQQPEIVSRNRQIASRYRRYARSVAPDIFPPTSDDPLLALPFSPRVYPHNFAVRYPEITDTELVVEVPDEVASGNQLFLCVCAHRVIQRALIELLKRPVGRLSRREGTSSLRLTWLSA